MSVKNILLEGISKKTVGLRDKHANFNITSILKFLLSHTLKFILIYSAPKAQSKFALRGAEFCNINLACEMIRREILLHGFWNFEF